MRKLEQKLEDFKFEVRNSEASNDRVLMRAFGRINALEDEIKKIKLVLGTRGMGKTANICKELDIPLKLTISIDELEEDSK